MSEARFGPFRGYYVALYAAPVVESQQRCYVAYYKICGSPPDSYWGATCILKGCVDEGHSSRREALLAAKSAAEADIGNIPVVDDNYLGRPYCLTRKCYQSGGCRSSLMKQPPLSWKSVGVSKAGMWVWLF